MIGYNLENIWKKKMKQESILKEKQSLNPHYLAEIRYIFVTFVKSVGKKTDFLFIFKWKKIRRKKN